MSFENNEATLQTIASMCRQEEDGYKIYDYLHQSQEHNAPCSSSGPLDIDADCRTKMVAWCYSVVDFCKFNRETVDIAMNMLDRFMATPSGAKVAMDRKAYQLAAMTTLYTAVKVHEAQAMDPNLVSTLSRGTYSAEEVEAMEFQILMSLTWRVNPPTAMAFVRLLLDLIPVHALDNLTRETVHDLAKFQTELAVSEYDFLKVKPSVVGYCSLMNALESIGANPAALSKVASGLALAIGLFEQPLLVSEIQQWLYQTIVNRPDAQNIFAHRALPSKIPAKTSLYRQPSCEVSPRSIAA